MSEPVAQPAEAADDLVADEQDAVFAANGLDPRPIAVGWDNHAAGALDRFADEGGDVLRPDGQDAVFQRLRYALGERIRTFAETLTEKIRLQHMFDAGNRQITLDMHEAHPAQRGRGDGRAMIGILA